MGGGGQTGADTVTQRSLLNPGPTTFTPLRVRELVNRPTRMHPLEPQISHHAEQQAHSKLPGHDDALECSLCSANCRYSPPTPAASTARPGGPELQMCMVIESFLHTAAHTAPLGTRHLPVQTVRRCVCSVRLGQHSSVCMYLYMCAKGVSMWVCTHRCRSLLAEFTFVKYTS